MENEHVAVGALTENFSPSPRIGLPPFGKEVDGIARDEDPWEGFPDGKFESRVCGLSIVQAEVMIEVFTR